MICLPVPFELISHSEIDRLLPVTSTMIKADLNDENSESLGEICCLLNGCVLVKDFKSGLNYYMKPEHLWQALQILNDK